MKILIRDSKSDLVWKDVTYSSGCFFLLDGSAKYKESHLYAIKDDNRNKMVVCSACRKEIPNTPASIRAHQNMVHSKDKCFDCPYLHKDNQKMMSCKYILNEDGTYTEKTTQNVNLRCGINWRKFMDINSEEANEYCRLGACQSAKFKSIEDFWTRYPGAFDEFITADRLIDTGHTESTKYNNQIWFDLKCKASVYAVVNEQGICTHFSIRYRHVRYEVRYSKKYDKAWYSDYESLRDLSEIGIAGSTMNSIMRKLRTLYE